MDALGKTTPALMTGSRRWSDLGVRSASAVVMVILAIVTTRKGGTLFLLFWIAAAVAILWEWQRLIGTGRLAARVGLGALALVAAAIEASSQQPLLALLVVGVGAGVAALLAGPGKRAWAASGMLYAGVFLVAVASLRDSFPFGARSIFWLFATVWATDCFAYFGGRLIGGPKLWPRISPSKTWSGTMTGVIAGGLIGSYVALRGLPQPLAVVPILALSFGTAALSQAGDALESAVKRQFGVKDTSRLIPGHGGVMDRLDGFIAAAIFAFAIGLIRNVPSIAGGLFYWA